MRGIESDLVLEGEWDQVGIKTGWKLEAFYQPVGLKNLRMVENSQVLPVTPDLGQLQYLIFRWLLARVAEPQGLGGLQPPLSLQKRGKPLCYGLITQIAY